MPELNAMSCCDEDSPQRFTFTPMTHKEWTAVSARRARLKQSGASSFPRLRLVDPNVGCRVIRIA